MYYKIDINNKPPVFLAHPFIIWEATDPGAYNYSKVLFLLFQFNSVFQIFISNLIGFLNELTD